MVTRNRHHNNFDVFGPPDEPVDKIISPAYQKQMAIHHKYLKQYKEIMSSLNASDAAKFVHWD